MTIEKWLIAAGLATAVVLPAHATSLFKPVELKDQELSELRGRYVMPGRIVSFGIVMSSTWQNASGQVIGASAQMQISQATIKPQFYVTTISQDSGNGNPIIPGSGNVTGGAGLGTTQGVTQVVRAAGDGNSAYNDVAINVKEGNSAPSYNPSGQVLGSGQTLSSGNGAGSVTISNTAGGITMGITAAANQGQTVQRLASGNLLQNTTLLGGANAVRNLTQLNVVLRDNGATRGPVNCNLDQLKGLRTLGY